MSEHRSFFSFLPSFFFRTTIKYSVPSSVSPHFFVYFCKTTSSLTYTHRENKNTANNQKNKRASCCLSHCIQPRPLPPPLSSLSWEEVEVERGLIPPLPPPTRFVPPAGTLKGSKAGCCRCPPASSSSSSSSWGRRNSGPPAVIALCHRASTSTSSLSALARSASGGDSQRVPHPLPDGAGPSAAACRGG